MILNDICKLNINCDNRCYFCKYYLRSIDGIHINNIDLNNIKQQIDEPSIIEEIIVPF
jgi:recombinational DNA repair protein RecR